MTKQTLFIILLSIIVVLLGNQVAMVLGWLDTGHAFITDQLGLIFSGGEYGQMIREILALILIPVIVVIVPATAYNMAKRKTMPCMNELVWGVWLVLATIVVIL